MEILEVFSPAVERILKHNTDFGRHPHLRVFVQDYLCGLYTLSEDHVGHFIKKYVLFFFSYWWFVFKQTGYYFTDFRYGFY